MPTLRRLLAETAGGLPRTFWYLWTGTLVNRSAGFVLVLLAFYLTAERGFSATFAGLVMGLYGGGSSIGVLAGGVLADRWGRRPTLILSHGVTAITLVGLGLAHSPTAILVWSVAFGVFYNAARPAFGAMMTDIVPPEDRVRAFSLNYWAINLGFSIAALLAGLVAQVDFLLLFLLDAGTAVATAVIIYLKVGESRPVLAPVSPAAPVPPRPDGMLTVLRDRVFLVFVGLTLMSGFLFIQHSSSLPMAMQRDGLSPSVYGGVIAINGILIVAGQLVVPRLLARHSHTQALAVSTLLIAIGFGLTAVADVPWFYAVTVVIWTLGEMANSPATSAVVAELSPAHLRGRYQSMLSLAFTLASMGAPIVGGFVIERYGDSPLWIGCFVVGMAAAIGHVVAGPARARRARLLRESEAAVVGVQ